MTNLWPWIAVAGLGALHGLNPANGWMFAAAWGVRRRGGVPIPHALLPIAIGHAASMALVAWAVTQGLSMVSAPVQGLAGALLIGAAAYRCLRGGHGRAATVSRPVGHAGMALWSFLMATAHGAGLMLVPALVPVCLGDGPARQLTASGSLWLALAAVGVHMAAMLATTGVIAAGVCRGFAKRPRLLGGKAARHAWTAALALTGLGLMTLG
jgi:hypothetical protein